MFRRDWVIALLCFLAIAILFAPDAAIGHGVFWQHDLRHHHFPWRVWGAERWLAGEVPWWSAATANGYPLLAEGETGFLYPPTMLLFMALPAGWALNWTILLHQVWTALGMWAFLRSRKLPMLASLLGGAVWAWSGFLVSHTLYLGMQNAVAWVAWAVFGAATARWGLVALSIAMMGLAGHPQAAAFGGLLLAVHAVATLRGRAVLAWGTSVVVGGLIAAPQLLSSLELSRFSMREGGVGDMFANIGRLPLPEVLNGVLPELFGFDRPADVAQTYYHRGTSYWGSGENCWEMCFYLGIPVVIFALVGARRNKGWVALAAVSILLMLGGPLWDLVRLLPGYGYFRFPVRFAIWLSFAVAVLAAEGFDSLRTLPRPWAIRRRIFVTAWLFGVGAVGGGLALRLAQAPVEAFLTGHYEAKLALPPPPFDLPPLAKAVLPPPELVSAEEIPDKVASIWLELWATTSVVSHRVWLPLLLLITTALALKHPRRLFALAVFDLWLFGHAFHPRVPYADTETKPDWINWEMTVPGGFRTTVLDRRIDPALDTTLGTASMNLLWGASDVLIPGPLLMLRNDSLLALAGLDVGDTGPQKVDRYTAHRAIANRMGLRWIASTHVIPGLAAFRRADYFVGVDTQALPRARVVPCVRGVETVDQAFAAIQEEAPTRTVVLEGGASGCEEGGGADTRIREYRNTHVWIEATGPGTLVLADSWYPGWTATVDGVPAPVEKADVVYRGVRLSPGPHTVMFDYDPGLPAKLLPLSLVLALGALGSVLMARRSSPLPPGEGSPKGG